LISIIISPRWGLLGFAGISYENLVFYNNITPLGFAGISYENLVFYNNFTPLGFYNDLVNFPKTPLGGGRIIKNKGPSGK